MNFEELGFGPEILKALNEVGYEKPTPIQEQAIPHILMTRDVIGLAQTGTGKTASFILPMIEVLHGGRAKARMPRSLILSPTRELAAQIAENFELYGKYLPLDMALLVGGSSMAEQMKKLDRGVDVLIATPGRLLDLFERGSILLNDIKIFVIDEADRMMDMGFIPDIEKIVSFIPAIRQTLLFSATMPPEIKGLSKKFLSNPKEVKVHSVSSSAKTVEQFLINVAPRQKKAKLLDIIKQQDVKNAFIFCNRKRDIDAIVRSLKNEGYNASPLHGDLPQTTRTKTLAGFKDGKVDLLVCSDVAARGIDVTDVSHVFNYDVPFNAEDYVHRIGRTGRAGKTGQSWTLATKDDEKYVSAIEELIGRKIGGQASKGDGKKDDQKKAVSKSGNGNKGKSSRSRNERPKNEKRNDEKPSSRRKNNDNSGRNNSQDDEADSFGEDIPAFLRR